MTLSVGATLVPVLFAFDATTHLTNFWSDGKVWPVYMSIGNNKSSIQNKPIIHAWVLVAILLNGSKHVKKVPRWSEENQEQEANQVLHNLLTYVLRPLSNTASDRVRIKCGDELIRSCHLRIAGWLVDQMENSTMPSIYTIRCPICESPQNKLGNLVKYPLRGSRPY